MSGKFFVVVSQLADSGKLVRELSGRLWATTANDADVEAGKYREELNWGSLEWMGEEFHIVMAVNEREVKKYAGHTKWWNNRVTNRLPFASDNKVYRRDNI